MAEFLETTYEKFIFKVKVGCLYSQEEFWADIQGNVATVGLTDLMQKAKGDVAFLETVEAGRRGQAGTGNRQDRDHQSHLRALATMRIPSTM